MKTSVKLIIVAAVIVAVIAAVALKRRAPSAVESKTPIAATGDAGPAVAANLPRLVDLGAGKCVPCKMMAPILVELQRDYADQFVTEFIDVWENPELGKRYGVELIPTQIFYDAEGKELFRHVGFFGKEDILAKWR